jgi:fibronectin-binding autotransporter adhesin
MKRVLWLTVLALALPLAAFADSVDFTNSGGILAGSSNGLSLTGSALIALNGLNGSGLVTGTDLGSVSFSTGALSGGSMQMGGTFAAGGSFTITGNGGNGIPNGTIFAGTFSGPATWTLTTLANGTHNYTLTGVVAGTLGGGFHTDGVTVQLTVNTGRGFFNGRTHISSGDTNVVVPEPGSLSLLGTGLLGLAGVMRRKLKVG